MNLLRLRDTNETPPDGYRYIEPADGFRVGPHNSKAGWLEAVKRHKLDNGYPLPENWKEEAEDQLARILPPGWQFFADGSVPNQYVNSRMGMDDVINGTMVLVEFVRQGAPLVDQELAESRGRTCAACYYNAPVAGCAPCRGLSNLVEDVAQQRKTAADAQLQARSCLICKCVSRAHIWLPADVLAKGVTPEMMEIFPDFCWKKAEVGAL